MLRMPVDAADTIDLASLPAEVAALIERLQQQAQADAQELARREREIALARVKIDKLNFELARFKRWKFGAKTEAMTAEQRLLFADVMAEDEASLRAKLAELQRGLPETPKTPKAPRAKPRRQALPEHLERVEHRHEPEDTTCPNAGCGRPMQRIGEDVSEKLDIIPAKFFVHRHIYGKWACRCCQQLRQEPAEPDVIDGGIPAAGLVAHILVSRFVDHLPYYRQSPINARSGVYTPRSTLASWGVAGGASLEPLFDLLRRFVLGCPVLHADETPLRLLDPGAGKTKKVYVWAWARSHHDPHPGVVYEFCLGRGAQYPLAFLGGKGPPRAEPVWHGTLVTDQCASYNSVLDAKVYPQRKAAACAAHARRRFEELSRGHHSASAVATEAMLRWTRIYRAEAAYADMGCDERRQARQVLSRPLWEEFEVWLKLQRTQVLNGTKIAEAIDYSLNAWAALTLHLDDGAVPIDNNLIERQIKPWKLGAKNWLFAGSALAGQRAAVVMSLVQSAKLNGLDPWAYLRDVLARIHTHPNNRLDELLPHRWRPA
jgi:transposase